MNGKVYAVYKGAKIVYSDDGKPRLHTKKDAQIIAAALEWLKGERHYARPFLQLVSEK